jgi:hypothetical protein
MQNNKSRNDGRYRYPHLTVSSPQGNLNPPQISPYTFEVEHPPINHVQQNSWDSPDATYSQGLLDLPARPRSRTTSAFGNRSNLMAPVNEADLHRSSSATGPSIYQHSRPRHRPSRSDLGPSRGDSVASESSYYDLDDFPVEVCQS